LLQYIDAVIMKFFRSPCSIQTPSKPVSYRGGWVQIAQGPGTFLDILFFGYIREQWNLHIF